MLLAGTAVPASATAANPDGSNASSVVLTDPPKPSSKDSRPKGVKAVKGDFATSKPASSTSRAAVDPPVFFRYVGARQFLASGQSASGIAANLILDNTNFLDTARGDYHTLGEIGVQSQDAQSGVEVGFTKDPLVCGAGVNKICLFAFWKRNGVGQCYNGCGFVDVAAQPINLGADLTADVGQKRFQILHTGTAWWIAYNANWIGYYPDSLWSSTTTVGPGVTFTSAPKMQAWYEVASAVDKTCSDIGNGYPVTDVLSSRVGSMVLTDKVPSTIVDSFTGFSQLGTVASTWPAAVMSTSMVTATTYRASGPMWDSAGTGTGIRQGC